MFSGLSKLADRNFIVGFFLPTLMGGVLLITILNDFSLGGSFLNTLINGNDTFKDLTVFAGAIWVISVLLSVLNLTFYQILEGYLGPLNIERRYEKYRKLYKEEEDCLEIDFDEIDLDRELYYDAYVERLRKFALCYPINIELVLPTEFGNVIRAFETYPAQVYGVDGVAAWLRLAAVMPKDYLAAIENAKANVDFFISLMVVLKICIVASVVNFVVSICEVMSVGPVADADQLIYHVDWRFLASAAALGLVDWLVYRGAISRARVWGEFVKSAFDVFLPDLASKLGYRLPKSWVRKKEFWRAITTMYLDLNPRDLERWLIQRGQITEVRRVDTDTERAAVRNTADCKPQDENKCARSVSRSPKNV